jgi:hypothetical protein
MPREAKVVRTKRSSRSPENRRMVRVRAVLALNVVAYLTLAGVSVAWLPDYRAILVMLVAFVAHRSAYMSSKGFK